MYGGVRCMVVVYVASVDVVRIYPAAVGRCVVVYGGGVCRISGGGTYIPQFS